MTSDTVSAIEIPDATAEPAAYVQALIGTLGDRDPLEVFETTVGEVRRLCQGLSVEITVPRAAVFGAVIGNCGLSGHPRPNWRICACGGRGGYFRSWARARRWCWPGRSAPARGGP